MDLMNDPTFEPLWKRGFGNELGCLFQGIHDIQVKNTCFFVELTNNPKERQITYEKNICDYKTHKKGKERVRFTVGGDRLDYSGEVATSTADMTTFKILINSTLSTKDAYMMMTDINNYYLGTPLPGMNTCACYCQYPPRKSLTSTILRVMTVDGWVYIKIRKGMYGLKQAGLLANQLLQKHLAPFD
jgi:hypothetical protein